MRTNIQTIGGEVITTGNAEVTIAIINALSVYEEATQRKIEQKAVERSKNISNGMMRKKRTVTRKKKNTYNYWTEEEDKKVIEIFKLPRTKGGYVRKELLDALCKELPRHTRKAISHRGRQLVDKGDPMRTLLLKRRWSQ